MIRHILPKDELSLTIYLMSKLGIQYKEANIKANKIIKSGFVSFLVDSKDLQGICWVEQRLIGDKKIKFVEILVNNWRLAESLFQVLKWNLNGEYWFSIPKHDFLNRTYNKNGIRFIKVDGNYNTYCYKFELRTFYNVKHEDDE